MAQRRNRRAGVEDLWTKRDGTPSARHGKGMRWRARYVDNLGKEHSKAFTRKVDAQSWLDGQTTALGTGTHIDPHLKITVAKLADRYKSSLGHLTDKSRYTRMSALNSRVIPRWGDVLIREILPSDVGSWITEMASEGLAAQTMSFYVGTLRQLLDVAVQDRQLAVNPAANAKVPKGGKRRAPHFLTAAQVHALAEASGRYGALIRTMGFCGLRPGEAAALTVADVDFDRRRIRVSKSYETPAGRLQLKSTKTGKVRYVPAPRSLMNELEAHVKGRGLDELVFTSAKGGVVRMENFKKRQFRAACEAVDGLPSGLIPYDLRHTAASLAIRSGANIKVIQAMLGHSSATLTLDRYGHLFPDDFGGLGEALESVAYPLRTGENEKTQA